MNFQDDEPSTSRRTGRRRSTRTRPNGNTEYDGTSEWRGERRSSRLGATADMQLDAPPPKRARTVDSNASATSTDFTLNQSNSRAKVNGAAALKPTERLDPIDDLRAASLFGVGQAIAPYSGRIPRLSLHSLHVLIMYRD